MKNSGLTIAGAILCIIGAAGLIIWSLIFFPIGLIFTLPSIVTLVLSSVALAKPDKRGLKVAAGIFGLLFGWLLGGILLLVGQSQDVNNNKDKNNNNDESNNASISKN